MLTTSDRFLLLGIAACFVTLALLLPDDAAPMNEYSDEEWLRIRLRTAVEEEDYETAAKIRNTLNKKHPQR